MGIEILDKQDVLRMLREHRQTPIYVTQWNVEAVVGLPRRDYLREARDGSFASTKKRRLVVSRTADVLEWIERQLCADATESGAPANDADSEAIALKQAGLRRIST